MSAAAFLLPILAATAAGAGGEEWPQWRGPGRTGAAAAPAGVGLATRAPADGLNPVWTADLGGGFEGGWASPVVAGGRAFVATAGRVRREGVKLPPPQFPRLSDEEEAALPAAEADAYETQQRAESLQRRKALFTGRETLHCFDAATGEELWTDVRDTPVTRFPQSSTPAVVSDGAGGGTVVLLGGDRVLRALDAATGEPRWDTTLPGEFDAEQISSSPLIRPGAGSDPDGAGSDPDGGGRIFVQAGRLFGVNLTDGALAWESDAVDGRDSSPAAFGPWVIVNGGGETVAVSAADGTEAWRLEDTGASRSSPVVAVTAAGEPRFADARLLPQGRAAVLRPVRVGPGRPAGVAVEVPEAVRPRGQPGRRRGLGAGDRRPSVGLRGPRHRRRPVDGPGWTSPSRGSPPPRRWSRGEKTAAGWGCTPSAGCWRSI